MGGKLSDWIISVVAWLSGIVVVAGCGMFVYEVWAAAHPTRPEAVYYHRGPQDPVDTH